MGLRQRLGGLDGKVHGVGDTERPAIPQEVAKVRITGNFRDQERCARAQRAGIGDTTKVFALHVRDDPYAPQEVLVGSLDIPRIRRQQRELHSIAEIKVRCCRHDDDTLGVDAVNSILAQNDIAFPDQLSWLHAAAANVLL
jgi:hypothetical protein